MAACHPPYISFLHLFKHYNYQISHELCSRALKTGVVEHIRYQTVNLPLLKLKAWQQNVPEHHAQLKAEILQQIFH